MPELNYAEALRMAQDRFYDDRRAAVLKQADARSRLSTMIDFGLPADSNDWVARLAWEALAFEFHEPNVGIPVYSPIHGDETSVGRKSRTETAAVVGGEEPGGIAAASEGET